MTRRVAAEELHFPHGTPRAHQTKLSRASWKGALPSVASASKLLKHLLCLSTISAHCVLSIRQKHPCTLIIRMRNTEIEAVLADWPACAACGDRYRPRTYERTCEICCTLLRQSMLVQQYGPEFSAEYKVLRYKLKQRRERAIHHGKVENYTVFLSDLDATPDTASASGVHFSWTPLIKI